LASVNFSQLLCSSSTWTWLRNFLGERRAVWYKRSSVHRNDNVERLQLHFTTTRKHDMFCSSTVVGFCTKTWWTEDHYHVSCPELKLVLSLEYVFFAPKSEEMILTTGSTPPNSQSKNAQRRQSASSSLDKREEQEYTSKRGPFLFQNIMISHC
jgi:hypothetical protein